MADLYDVTVVYLHGNNLGHPLLVLGLCSAVALSVLATVELTILSERRRQPHNTHEIYRIRRWCT